MKTTRSKKTNAKPVTKLTEAERMRVVELLKQSPHNPVAVLSEIKREMRKEISRSTLKRIARKAGLIWKRMRKSLGSKRDQKKFAASLDCP